MNVIELNKEWKYVSDLTSDELSVPESATDCDLPIDFLLEKPRDFNVAFGAHNGYYGTHAVALYKTLPRIRKCSLVLLEIMGAAQTVDVYVGGNYVATVEGRTPRIIDITGKIEFNERNTLKLVVSSSSLAGTYTGLGISDGVRLYTSDSAIAVAPYGVGVTVENIDDKAHLRVSAEISNDSAEKKQLTVEALLFNARGKRVARKVRKIKAGASGAQVCDIRVKLSRHYDWSVSDPYMYSCTVNVFDGEKLADSASAPFGIRTVQLSPRGLLINNEPVKLRGAVMSHDNGILGNASEYAAEAYKLSRIKALGYNAVRYTECPSRAVLDCADRLGLMLVVDLFRCWAQGNFPKDGHTSFYDSALAQTSFAVDALKSHPSVVMYSLGADVAESYGRGDGADVCAFLCDNVRARDNSRPITSAAAERVPTAAEIERAGGKIGKIDSPAAALNFGREKDLFRTFATDYFAPLDVAGYCYLYPRYASDKVAVGKPIVGLASLPCRAFDALDETEKNAHVIGDFNCSGADSLGYPLGKPIFAEEQIKMLPPHASYCGDLDLIYTPKPRAVYRRILNGDRSVSMITAFDPALEQRVPGNDHSMREGAAQWYFPKSLGSPVDVEVMSGGEVVALYFNGKLIGRKLAGRVNKHIASFKVEYYPGKLEAVSFHRGAECSRAVLESVSSPRLIKLECSKKTVSAGELCLIEVSVLDKEGRETQSSREIEYSVVGEGKAVAIGNGDPENYSPSSSTTCKLFRGKALIAVRGTSEGKFSVKVVGDGVLSAKATVKVK